MSARVGNLVVVVVVSCGRKENGSPPPTNGVSRHPVLENGDHEWSSGCSIRANGQFYAGMHFPIGSGLNIPVVVLILCFPGTNSIEYGVTTMVALETW